MTGPFTEAGVVLVDPDPTVVVLPATSVRPGVSPEGLPRFGDDIWQLAFLIGKDTTTSSALRWDKFPAVFRDNFKRLAWAVINIDTPEAILARPGSTSRARLRGSSLTHTVKAWKAFAAWLITRRITRLSDVTASTLADYAVSLREAKRTRNYSARQLLALTRIWAYAPYMLPGDRLPMPPWDEHGVDDYLGAPQGSRGRNRRVPIHPATMSPLLVWAIRFVTDLAPDILAAREESIRLLANVPQVRSPGEDAVLTAYFEHLRTTGQPLPGTTWFGARGRLLADRPHNAGTAISGRYIAATLGISAPAVTAAIDRLRPRLRELPISSRSDLDVELTARLGDRPWMRGIDFDQAPMLVMHLSTACLIVIAYLSGMRPEEVLHLRQGCCAPTESSEDGIVRYHVTGLHFKGVNDDEGNSAPAGELRDQPWTVIAPVAAAITVLERLTEPGGLLFPVAIDGHGARSGGVTAWRGAGLTTRTAAFRVGRFIAFANELARDHARDHELVPEDPAGPISLSRFRQTIGWFVNRLPGGRVALGIQYGHLQLTMSEAYGSRAGMDMMEILDLERARTLVDTLGQAAERLRQGEHVSGPAADRYAAGASEFTATYQGGHLTERQHKALLGNHRLRVFDHDEALLACNHNPLTALCDPDRATPGRSTATPSFDRCNTACVNVARTDTHIDRVRREVEHLQDEIDTGLDPHPIRERHRQRRLTLLRIIDQHERGRPDPHDRPEPAQ
ncbi:integrase [Actinokineospora iranica]|uniref:Integrase n=1 Tax=Actinokineospora iranica TaxID=1271860 RepID=A0A1G6NCS3_9PSEU|nr:integrase [Actinokineospora iranica]SDC65633.1 hypothetical protein SAMN05216174_103302 [Actinokineospora iranica]